MIKNRTNEQVILVNKQNKTVGTCEKHEAHRKGLLHRAFSIFILRKRQGHIECLLQQRQLNKYHSGGLWANACCSHPRPNESTEHAALRRLHEEMGLCIPLYYVGHFIYNKKVGADMTEHELDHVFVGTMHKPQPIEFNPNEVMSTGWTNLLDLRIKALSNPSKFCAWFSPALQFMLDNQSRWDHQLFE